MMNAVSSMTPVMSGIQSTHPVPIHRPFNSVVLSGEWLCGQRCYLVSPVSGNDGGGSWAEVVGPCVQEDDPKASLGSPRRSWLSLFCLGPRGRPASCTPARSHCVEVLSE